MGRRREGEKERGKGMDGWMEGGREKDRERGGERQRERERERKREGKRETHACAGGVTTEGAAVSRAGKDLDVLEGLCQQSALIHVERPVVLAPHREEVAVVHQNRRHAHHCVCVCVCVYRTYI